MKGIEQNYTQHIGSQNFYQHSTMFPLYMSEGIKHVAKEHQCFWLMDVIGSYLPELKKTGEFFAVATLEHNPAEGKPDQFIFRLQDDIPSNTVYAEQIIEFSDFPKEGIRLYVSDAGQGNYTVFLPSEY